MKDWSSFFHRFGGAKRIPGPVYRAAAKLDSFRLSLACLKALVMAPKASVEGGVCKWFGANEITALEKENAQTAKVGSLATEVLDQARDLLASAGVPRGGGPVANVLTEQFCFLDASVARIVLGKAGEAAKAVHPGVKILDRGGFHSPHPWRSSLA